MRTRHHVLHLMANREWFESPNAYASDESYYIAPVRALLPAGWSARREGVWFQCMPPGAQIPPQGWKIHVSATTHTADYAMAYHSSHSATLADDARSREVRLRHSS